MNIARVHYVVALSLLSALFCWVPFGVTEEVSLTVNGMVCAFCAQGVTKTLKGIEGVQDVQVNIEGQQVVITLKDGASVENAVLEDAIKKAGYSVISIQRGAVPTKD